MEGIIFSMIEKPNPMCETWTALHEETAISAVEEANQPGHQPASHRRRTSTSKKRKGSLTSVNNEVISLERKSQNRRQSLPVQLEYFQVKHGASSPISGRSAARGRRGSVQKYMPVIEENPRLENTNKKGSVGRRQSLSVLDTNKFAASLRPLQQSTICSNDSEDEFTDYFKTIPKIKQKPKFNYSKAEMADPLEKITRQIFVELDEDCDGHVDKNDLIKVCILNV